MTIWLLALLVLATVTLVGYNQGAIRTGISFFGIILAFFLAPLAGKIFVPLLGLLGVTSPLWLWALPPLFGFILVSALVKTGAFFVHQKVDVYYKYKAGDLRLALWERLNKRLGACVGVLNGVAYLVLLSFIIYIFGYWTVQLATSENDPKTLRLMNVLARDLQSTAMDRVGKSIDPLKTSYYDTADLAGLMFQNPLLEARFLRYPGFLSLGERPEFQALGKDQAFADLRSQASPINSVLDQPSAQAIFSNPDLLHQIWDTLQPDLPDLQEYLLTGKSAKYDSEKLLGRWIFNTTGTMLAFRRAKPNLSGGELTRMREFLKERFEKCMIVAAPDKMLAVKNFPQGLAQPGMPLQTTDLKGTWAAEDGNYEFNLEGSGERRTAKFEGNHLILSGDIPLAFRKED
ncbi:MAG TPA: CvpA family protein [Verrucomicrobiota bacterium]|nr:CvpA family protein [Verrucomicrobiota bacterium]HNT14670.1 CvpA family protein [Verrucomicrobiota bacterium]